MDLSEDLCLARRAAISSISEPLIPPTPKTEYPFACQRRRRRSMTARLNSIIVPEPKQALPEQFCLWKQP